MFKVNDTVSHPKFGTGMVLEVQEGRVRVQFEEDEKLISEKFLELVVAGEEVKINSFTDRPKGPLLMSANIRFSEIPPDVTRIYQVNKWIWTRCPENCQAYQEDNRCGHQRSFPVPYLVRLGLTEDGVVVRGACSEGRNGEKGPCSDPDPDKGCPHVQRAIMYMEGEQPDDGDPMRRFSCEIRNIVNASRIEIPKCPNCNSRGMVKPDGKKFVCTSGTCMRVDSRGREQPYRFKPGDGKLKPRWKNLAIREGYQWK